MRVGALVVAAALLATTMALASHGGTPSHPADACSAPFHLQGAGWDACMQQDDVRAQGIELNQVYFHGEPVIDKIGFPFSITRYEDDRHGPFKDTLGRSFGGGQNPGFGRGSMEIHPSQCPRFLAVGTIVNEGRLCVEHRGGPEPGVAVWARYDIFNYRFLQGYILDSRGVLEPFVRLGGLLIDGDTGGASGTNHFHHLYWRVDFDVAGPDNAFQMFLRPHEDWNDWEPYTTWQTGEAASACLENRTTPACLAAGDLQDVDPLGWMPDQCRQQIEEGTTGWCDVAQESLLVQHASLATKWRVHNPHAFNAWGRTMSFESTGKSHQDASLDGNFSTFHALVAQHRGPSREIGFEVPALPHLGDQYLHAYADNESLHDPIVWFAIPVYHDTRDEEKPTMVYHHVSFTIEPRNFFGSNPGEDTYAPGVPVDLPGIDPGGGGCVGPVCA